MCVITNKKNGNCFDFGAHALVYEVVSFLKYSYLWQLSVTVEQYQILISTYGFIMVDNHNYLLKKKGKKIIIVPLKRRECKFFTVR